MVVSVVLVVVVSFVGAVVDSVVSVTIVVSINFVVV